MLGPSHPIYITHVPDPQFDAFKIPKDSPLRRTHSLFWGVRTNNIGVGGPSGFYPLVQSGDIELVAPARVASYGEGKSIILHDGRVLEADLVVLATGFTSSWNAFLNGAFSFLGE